MTALIVIGVLILLSVLLANAPVTAHIKFYGGRLELALKYLGIGIGLFPIKKRGSRRKKRKRSRLPSPKKNSLEEDEEIFEDIAEIGFGGGSNAGSELESGFDEDNSEEGDVNSRGNERGKISGEEFAGGGYSTENSEEKAAEISVDNSENSKENSTDNSEKIKKNSKEKSTEKKSGKNSSEKKSNGSSDDKSNEDEPKKPLGERLSELLENIERKKNAALLLWELCEGHLRKLLGKITVEGLVVDFAAADEDAARAALSYGKLCAAFYNLLGVIMGLTRVGIKSVSIDCLYDTPSEKARYDGEFKIKMRPGSLLNALAAILFDYIRGGGKYKSALNEFIGGGKAAASRSVSAFKRYRAAKRKKSA